MPFRPSPVALALLAVAAATSGALPNETTVRASRDPCTVAVALRDLVPGEQMLGTMLFTRPLLAAGYDEHVYIEAGEDDDGRGRLLAAFDDARDRECTVDLFFLAHGDDFAGWVSARDVALPRLRLVYDTGAGGAAQGDAWIALGAEAFVGHPGANLAPIFYGSFLPAWIGGATVEQAVARSNRRTHDTMRRWRAVIGDDTESLWHGTRAIVFGDGATSR